MSQELLKSSASRLVLASTKKKISDEATKNNKWISYSSDQKQAESLAKAGKYAEALILLNNIPSSYPTYSGVNAEIINIQKQIAAKPVAAPANTPAAATKPVTVP